MVVAYAGLVMSIPIRTPSIVVSANPFNMPATKVISGSMTAIIVAADVNIIKNALRMRSETLTALLFCPIDARVSSVMTIWLSTPVPTAAIIPAIAVRSISQFNKGCNPEQYHYLREPCYYNRKNYKQFTVP